MAQRVIHANQAAARLNRRDPLKLAGERFDLIIIGGGVYGAMTALEAVRRGLRPLILERADFAGATSSNSLRIIHGGLRYLQSADLGRYLLSIRERAWFIDTFPDYVRPLPVLMPLHGNGLRRRSIFRGALALNNFLSGLATGHMPADPRLPAGRTVSAEWTRDLAPAIDATHLEGGALWHDAFIPCAPALVIDILRWACSKGAAALNYVEVRSLVHAGDRVAGVRVRDIVGARDLEFRGDIVINAAGPWACSLGEACGASLDGVAGPSLAWNVVLQRPAWCDHALALTPAYKGAQTYFLVPWKGVILAGTGHAPWHNGPGNPHVSAELLQRFIDDLNMAVPGFDLSEHDVARVLVGLLPAQRAGSQELSKHFTIVDHARRGGPKGLFSLSGVKFTEARAVADRALRAAFPTHPALPYKKFARPMHSPSPPDYAFAWLPKADDLSWLEPLREIVRQEDVEHLDDLLLRRSNLGDNPDRAIKLAPLVCKLWDWDTSRTDKELAAMQSSLRPAGVFVA